MLQFEELGFKGLKAGCSEFFTLYDKLRQQRDENDRFRQADVSTFTNIWNENTNITNI